MAAALPQFPAFNISDDTSGVGVRWKKYLSRFNNLLIALSITEPERKRALLLHYVGEDTMDIFDTLPDTGGEKDFIKAVDALTAYFSPQQNIDYATFKFRQTKQLPHETIDTYHTKLQQLAATCEFHSKDREIKAQIIQHCTSSRLRRRALREPDMDLSQLLQAARAMEISEKQATGIEESSSTVNKINQTHGNPRFKHNNKKPMLTNRQKNFSSKSNNMCRNCGGTYPHPKGRSSCPAYGEECSKCNKPNHFAKFCLSSHNSNYQQPRTQTYNKHKPRWNKPPKRVNTVTEEQHYQSSSDDEYIFTLHDNNSKRFPQFNVNINGTEISIIADTGAGVNLLDEQDFDIINPKPILSPSHIKLYPYKSVKTIPILGQFNAQISSKTSTLNTIVYVVSKDIKGFGGSLLSWRTAIDLNLVQIIQEIYPKTTVDNLVQEYSDLFSGIGKLKGFQVKLHIDNNIQPVAQPHRRVPFHLRDKVKEQLELDEKLGIIEKVDGPTPWVSPIVVAPKPKNPEKVRICVDMRSANKAILRERHITPTVDDIVNDLNGSTVFSKLDLNQGYNQLELTPESRNITTFSTHLGLRRYTRLSFGISSAAEIFQNAIRESLSGLPGVINISDDVLIHAKTQEQHDKYLRATFQRLREKNLTLNKDKCVYNKTRLEFYGYIFSANGMSPDPKKIESILGLPNPTNATEVRSLLGMINYSSRFIPNYATLTEPLRILTHKDVPWTWTEQQEQALNSLKQALVSTPVMAYFDPLKNTEIIVDASPVGLGAILVQKSDNASQIISYASHALSRVEQRYSQTEREALSIVWACEHFHLYIYGKPVTVITDHKPLEGIFNNPASKPSARLERWSLRLQPYSITVKYEPGANNPADYMSRHPGNSETSSRAQRIAEEYVNFVTEYSTPKAITIEEIRSETKTDQVLQQVAEMLKTGKWDKSKNSKILKSYASAQNELSALNDGTMLCGTRIVIPQSLQKRTVQQAHTGHQGVVKTKRLLRTKVWFPGMDAMVESIVNSCIACQSANPENKSRTEPLQMSQLPISPWTELSADFCGPMPSGDYLLVVYDAYSRFPEVERLSSTKASATVPALDKIFATHGLPVTLKTDNGPPFQSSEFSNFMTSLGIHHQKITPFWPRANGGVERFMKTLGKAIRTAHIDGKNWKQELYSFLRNYRATPHSTTNKAPATVLFNREIRTNLPEIPLKIKDSELRKTDTKAKQRMKTYSDKKHHPKPHRIRVGDTVLVRNKKVNKLSPPFLPLPYTVVNVKDSMITAEREGHNITRNSSFFKLVEIPIDEPADDIDEPVPSNEETRRYPQRDRRLPSYLQNYELN